MLRRLENCEESRWLVVNTQPGRECLAIANLNRQGFETYCPMVSKRIRHARRTLDARRPLFPSYLFVNFNSADRRWRRILSTQGVRAMVRSGDLPGFLGGDFIEGLRAREVDGVVCRPEVQFSIGQQVRLQSGPFDGLIGKIVEMREQDRLVVLLDLLNRSVKLNIHAHGLAHI